MIDKPCQPDHEMIRELLNGMYCTDRIPDADYCILMDYVNDCECLLELSNDGPNRERQKGD